jgi:hypothetical protein
MYRIPKDMIPCKWGSHWDEFLGEKWMDSCPMFECIYDGDKIPLAECEENDKCPAYEPVSTKICPKHDREYYHGDECSDCMREDDERYRG